MVGSEIVLQLLSKTFFEAWKNRRFLENTKYINFSTLELQITASCDQRCSYCYYHRFGKFLNPPAISKKKNILNNLKMLLRWLSSNKYFPKIEIFSGEPFSTEIGFLVIEKVIDWQIQNSIDNDIIIPSNFSFILDKGKTYRVEKLLDKARSNGFNVILSASVDGKYLDKINRPFFRKVRTKDYYDKIFSFQSKWGYSFHPMIYSKGIDLWEKNFLWFQEMFDKFNINWQSLYLLEVRNYEWTLDQIKEFYRFIRFVVRWAIDRLRQENIPDDKILQEIYRRRLFNIFSAFFGTGRGIGCSIQSSMQLRLGDLTVSPCHRTAYDQFNMYRFVNDGEKITGIDVINPYLVTALYSADFRVFPFCELCGIKDLCNGPCLGSNYEFSGDLFITAPTVCLLEHARVFALIDELDDLKLLKYFYTLDCADSLNVYKKYIKGEENA